MKYSVTRLAAFIIPLFVISNFVAHAKKPLDTRFFTDIPYYENTNADSNLTKLNLIIPETDEKEIPVFLWIGGGAWAYVDRKKEMDICFKMAEQGIIVLSVGHRLSPALIWEPFREEGVKHPEHVRDIAKAVKWTVDNIEKYGGSKDKIFIGGFSSGAQLSALLGMDERYLKEVGLSFDNLKGIIPIAGCFDIQQYKEVLCGADPSYAEKHFDPVFGKTEEELIEYSPMTYLDSLQIPMLVITEGQSYVYTEVFEKAIKEKGYHNAHFINLYDESHRSLWMKLRDEKNCMYRNYIVDYIYKMSEENE
jgi:hypothetical protein